MKFTRIAITGLAVAGGLLMSVMGTTAYAGIANTKHNLSSDPDLTNRARSFSGTEEICVFCHTPHGADTSASVPLWNRALNGTPGTTYTTYDDLGTTTLDAQTANVGSVSIACLSCHDGTQAMETVINAPGSGGFNPAGAAMTGTWTPNGDIGANNNGIAEIGVDLRNDHPVGIQYCGGGVDTTNTDGANCADPDFTKDAVRTVGANSWVLAYDAGKTIWWVDDNDGSREKTDFILYTRGAADGYTGQTGDEPFVECASCHDPHTENATFLRTANTGSGVCLACHNK